MRYGLFVGACVVGVCLQQAGAAEIALTGGKTARLVDPSGTTHDKTIVKFARDAQLFVLQDPRCPASSSIRMRSDAQDTGVITLPCINWKTVGAGFRYDDPSGSAGGVQRIDYRSGTLKLRLGGGAYTALHGAVAYVEARFNVGATRYCGRFDTIKRNTATAVTAKGPTAGCQPICGDNHVDAPEQCDDGNTINGDCCSSTCQFETSACDDGDLCTTGDTCSNGQCISTPVTPWINELDYDDFTGILDDRDEFIEIAAPAGTDLSGFKLLAVEGNLNGNTQTQGAPCYSDLETGITTGNPYWTAVIPPGTVLADKTGTGIGYFVACFTNSSANHVALGQCDAVLPAPSTSSNLKNGYLLNNNQVDCPDGILMLDPYDNLVDAISYEGQVPNMGLFGHYFQTPSYNAGQDQGWVPGVSMQKITHTLARATSGAEWKLSGGCIAAAPAENPRVTTLSGAISATATTINLVNVNPSPPFFPPFPATGTVHIESEMASYTGLSGNTLTGVQRGVNGTTPAAHADGATVTLETGCAPNSNTPGATNTGEILSCVPGSCGNGVVNSAAGELCDPNAVPSGCPAGQGCVAAGDPDECTCVPLCGNGIVDAGEQCDPPDDTSQCAGGTACNSDCTCPPPPQCVPMAYTVSQSDLDLCTAIFGACPPPVPLVLAPPTKQTTFELCFGQPDAAGRLALSIDPTTWFGDAEFVPAGATSPIPLTQRFCQSVPATGTLFTQATSASYPAKRCLAGDPAAQLRSCVQNADCDGPAPTVGNGICGTRDLDYTSVTTAAGTTFSFGDGTPDPAGSLLLVQPLDVQAFLGQDYRCTGNGMDPNCVACDAVTPAGPGRIGVPKSVAVAPSLILPLLNNWTTGSAENKVMEAGNFIDGREVSGAGAIHDTSPNGQYEVVAADAALNVSTPIGLTVHIQFLTKNLWAPVP